MTQPITIRLSDLDLTDRERGYAEQALRSGWISSAGEYVGRAERAWAAYCGAAHGTAVCNGTAALHLALMALGLKPGDEVIVPGMTFVSPAAVVTRMGGVPVLADIEETSWCLDPDDVERLITSRTRGVIAVDVLGHPADYDRLRPICDRHGLFLLEDAAQAHGAKYKGRCTGNLADIATFSFFANKTLGCGEGGMVLTSDPRLNDRMVRLKNHGMTIDRPYWHEEIGDNFRLTNLVAAILYGQIERADELVAGRNAVSVMYRSALAGVAGVSLRPSAAYADVATWLEVVRVTGEGLNRDDVVRQLRQAGIDARALWTPLADLPPFRAACAERGIETRRAKQVLSQVFWVPTASTMTEEQVRVVGAAIAEACGRVASAGA